MTTIKLPARKIIPGLAAAALAAGSYSPALAQTSQSVNTSAQIYEDITLLKISDLDFGRVIVPRNGRVDMTAEEVPACTANNTLQLLDDCQSAGFAGTAAPGFNLRVSVPPGRGIDLVGPGQDLRLRRITVGPGEGLAFVRRVNRNFDFTITNPAGEFAFYIGARLLFRNNQAPGVYTGSFDVDVEYE